ncbi:hypothetical protein BJF79_08475 [Actinomadura sp. CNU-125]|uniref:lipase/acyltransferase domain-containing protein n=1 Tax=Actinomadura sp. CNU-125 TaxID=1904961 RepID=UPI00095D1257|nr:hypothetical protein [Actinomadura sp. CNU-125]OLT32583.1 hypothetical protein BJF79_08475 [Actinomadura sp. CNU-125]
MGRIVPAGLLDTVEWAPLLKGIEPYGKLVRRMEKALAHPDALLKFAYDWRLSVEFNADRLATGLRAHLDAWRAHGARPADGPRPRAVIVAHSMGGLVAAAMCARHPDLAAEVRATVTLGTPFHGAVKAVGMLNTGRGVPLEHQALRDLARTLPGVHDLLPAYRCVLTGDDDVVELGEADAVALGADRELFRRARRTRAFTGPANLPGHRLVIGTGQATDQALRIRNTTADLLPHGFLRDEDDELRRDEYGRPVPVDHRGDGTVFRYSAGPPGGPEPVTLGQQHGALAGTRSALDIVRGVVDRVRLGTALGDDDPDGDEDAPGLVVPDVAETGKEFEIVVEHARAAGRVSIEVEDALGNGRPVARPKPYRDRGTGALVAATVLDEPGLYRIAVSAGSDPVTQIVLVRD